MSWTRNAMRNRGRAARGPGLVGAVLVLLLAGTAGAQAAPPPPPSITLNSVTPYADPTDCEFRVNYTVSGLKGKPSQQWGVAAIVPVHIFPGNGTAGLGFVTKADNDIPQDGIPNLSHPNDGHATAAWWVYLVNTKTNSVVALDGPVSVNSTCS